MTIAQKPPCFGTAVCGRNMNGPSSRNDKRTPTESLMTAPDRRYRWLFWTLALVGFTADQASKYGIFAWLYADVPGMHVHPVTRDPICERPFVVVPETLHLVARYSVNPWIGDGILHQLRTVSGPTM